jgi:hypothetical protein
MVSNSHSDIETPPHLQYVCVDLLAQLLLAECSHHKVALEALVVKVVAEHHQHLRGADGDVGVDKVAAHLQDKKAAGDA